MMMKKEKIKNKNVFVTPPNKPLSEVHPVIFSFIIVHNLRLVMNGRLTEGQMKEITDGTSD